MVWGAAIALGACVPPKLGPAIDVVETRTPGVSYVIVHPDFKKKVESDRLDDTGNTVSAESDYVLLCDARASTGMTCMRPPEVATSRLSFGTDQVPATQPVEEKVGVLADVSIESSHKTKAAEEAEPQPPPPPTTPPPAEPPPAPEPENGEAPEEGGAS